MFAPEAGLEGLGPALHALEVDVAVEEAARERDGVVAGLQPHLPHAPDRLVVGCGHLDHAVVVERPHRRVPAVL